MIVLKGTKQVRSHHLILLAKNRTGYVNLMKVSEAEFKKICSITSHALHEMLKRYLRIIALQLVFHGIIPRMLLKGRPEEAALGKNLPRYL